MLNPHLGVVRLWGRESHRGPTWEGVRWKRLASRHGHQPLKHGQDVPGSSRGSADRWGE
jgi:hypothetical protein